MVGNSSLFNSSFFKYRDTMVFMFVEEIILRWLNIVSLDKGMIY